MTPAVRADLLALTADGLAALANRGLVKRATKELDEGKGPAIAVEEDGTVEGRFADGVVARLPVGTGLDEATCTCAATGVCRHRVAVVLAYQRAQAVGGDGDEAPPPPETGDEGEEAAPAFERWSPGEFDDEALEAALGTRLLAAARRAHRAGYVARVHRPTEHDPVPHVELSSCTVRFLVPHELAYVHTDAAKGTRDDVIALAVWAFRAADERAPDGDLVSIDIGGSTAMVEDGSGLEGTIALLDELLLDGTVHAGASSGGALARVQRDLDTKNLRWPLLALDELTGQLDAYRDRSARYRPERIASLLVELHARHRSVVADGASLRSSVLGTEEAAETPLRHARLISLGCRVTGTTEDRNADIYLVHADTGVVLVLRRRWDIAEDEAPTGYDLSTRRLGGGSTLAAFAGGNVVTESAARSASRLVRIASNRVAKTTVAPSGGGWGELPASVLVRDVERLATAMADLPPRVIRPRVEAEFVRAVAIGEVVELGYAPGAQQLRAIVTDAVGGTAMIEADYRAVAPAALDTLAAALRGDHGPPRFLSGSMHRTHGTVVIDPFAVAVDGKVIVPDLAPGDGTTTLALAIDTAPEPMVAALSDAVALLSEAAHRGLAHLPTGFPARVERSAAHLRRVGLLSASAAVESFATSCTGEPDERTTRAWVDAHLRLLVTADCL